MKRFLSLSALGTIWFMLAIVLLSYFFLDTISAQEMDDKNINQNESLFTSIDNKDLFATSENNSIKELIWLMEEKLTKKPEESIDNRPIAYEDVVINDLTKPAFFNNLLNENSRISDIFRNSLIIKKPSNLSGDYVCKIEDKPIDRTLTFLISGLDEGMELSREDVARFRRGVFTYFGKLDQICTRDPKTSRIDYSITFKLDTPYMYSLVEGEEYFLIKCDEAKDFFDRVVVIDAGHGGKDPGTVIAGTGNHEKIYNLAVLTKVKRLFEKHRGEELISESSDLSENSNEDAEKKSYDDSVLANLDDKIEVFENYVDLTVDGISTRVYFTRTKDERLKLNDRVQLANLLKADLFLSIHCNSSENSLASGYEVLYNEDISGDNTKTNDVDNALNENESEIESDNDLLIKPKDSDSSDNFDKQSGGKEVTDNFEKQKSEKQSSGKKVMSSERFAKICLEEGLRSLPRFNRGLVPRGDDVVIINRAKMPVALLELGYLSNKEDLKLIQDEKNQELIAEGIYNAIIRAIKELD